MGNSVKLTVFVDSDHAGNLVTRRLQTGFFLFLQNLVIDWHSKKQNACELSAFGSEFVAARICVEKTKALRHELRMFGILIDGCMDVCCDHDSVVKNGLDPISMLMKKHLQINCHHAQVKCFHGCVSIWLDQFKE